MVKKKMTNEALEFFRELGKEYGHLGGKAAAARMTKRERRLRALKAVAAREAKRKAAK